jgi:hypothetical protein
MQKVIFVSKLLLLEQERYPLVGNSAICDLKTGIAQAGDLEQRNAQLRAVTSRSVLHYGR